MSSYGYISYPIETNSQDLLDEIYAFIKSKAPSWVENDANLDVWLAQIIASQAADLRMLASDVPDTIFRYFGSSLLGIPPIAATQARTTSTWTMRDDAGYTIPDGTFVTIRDAAGNNIVFATSGSVIVPAGSSVTATGEVLLVAVQEGSAGTGLGSVDGPVDLLDTLEYVTAIVQEDITTGGVDSETPSEYNDRLTRYLRRLSTRPILPDDFANMALDVVGVYRAMAIDGYDPVADSFGNERMVTVSAIDANGTDIDSTAKNELLALFNSNREVNFVVGIMDAKRTAIAVTYSAVAVQGFDPMSAQDNADAALADYLSPASWGRDPRYTDSAQTWVQVDNVYYFEIAQVISNATGIDRVTSLVIGVDGGSLAAADVAISKPASLTTAGTISGTVT